MASDWYLPSKDEFNAIYTAGISFPLSAGYWTSSEVNATTAWAQNPINGIQAATGKSSNLYVRAIRSFVADASLYALKDVGPSGGWVFYKSGTSGSITYLEVASVDQSTSIAWITGGDTQTELNGNTLTAVGTGLANTNAMAADDGYTGGAAKVCLDLVGGYNWVNIIKTGMTFTKVAVDEISTNLATERTAKGLGAVGAPSITQYATKILKTHMDTWRSMATDVVRYGASNVPTWSESITQYATKIKALHFNELKQVADDAINMARCYTNACSASCGVSCIIACTSDCSTSCSSNCTSSCKNACSTSACTGGTCSVQCGTACTGHCLSACSGACTGGTCLNTCDANNCENNCLYWCNVYCAATCKVACAAGLNNTCASCAQICNNNNCKGASCGGNCTAVCTKGCLGACGTTTCTGYCYASCTGSCGSACTGACGSGCAGTCMANGGSCGGTCSASTCSEGCGVNCTSACYANCTGSCQFNCYTTCNLGCYSGCTTTSRVGTDAGAL